MAQRGTPAARAVCRRWAVGLRVVDRMGPVLLASVFVLSALAVLARYPIGQNADGLIQTIFSLQKMTLFYWGQDRYANLLPALAMPLRDPATNAFAQLAMRTALGMLAPLFFCALATRSAGAAWRATALATTLLLALGPARTMHEAFIEASPYGASFALAGLALLAFQRARGRVAWRVAGVLLTCAAYLMNVSLALFAGPLLAGHFLLFRSALAAEFAAASVVALGVTWAGMALAAPEVPTLSGFGETTVGLVYFAERMLDKPGRFLIAMLLLSVALLLARAWRRDSGVRAAFGHGALLLVTAVTSFVALGLSSWVVVNYMHPRYLVPEYFLFAAMGGLSVVALAGRTRGGRATVLALCAVLLVVAARRSPPSSPAPHDIMDPAWRTLADTVAGAALERGSDAIAGDYWQVWPAVFQAEQLASALGQAPGRVFGLGYRSEARRTAFIARLLGAGRVRIACIAMEPVACSTMVTRVMTLPKTVMREDGAPAALPDGQALWFVMLELPAR